MAPKKSEAQYLEDMRRVFEKLLDDELLPPRAAKYAGKLTAETTPEDLGMDSLARFALLGELKKLYGKKIDPRAISSARCVGDVIRALKEDDDA
jgi:acyl carrier protein